MRAALMALMGTAAACSTTAPTIAPDVQKVAAPAGLVVGSFGLSPEGDPDAVVSSRSLLVVTLGRERDHDKEWWLPFDEGASFDGSKSAPFLVELPAGVYRATEWVLEGMARSHQGRDFHVRFEVLPGRLVCIGALKLVRDVARSIKDPYALGHQTIYTPISMRVLDECPKLAEFVHTSAPSLRTPMEKLLGRETR